eukprot:scaffold8605_cov178-Amphora_coffeaeformis.AAC.10
MDSSTISENGMEFRALCVNDDGETLLFMDFDCLLPAFPWRTKIHTTMTSNNASSCKVLPYSFDSASTTDHATNGAPPLKRVLKGNVYLFGHREEQRNAPHLVLLCAGYPDDETVFTDLAQQIAVQGNYLVGVMVLPGFETKESSTTTTTTTTTSDSRHDGNYSFVDWRDAIQAAVQTLRNYSTHPTAKLTGIFHDWGCLAGLMYTNHVMMKMDDADADVDVVVGDDDDDDDDNDNDDASLQTKKNAIPDQLILFDVLLDPHPYDRHILRFNKKNTSVSSPSSSSSSRWNKYYTLLGLTSYQIILAQTWLLHRYVHRGIAMLYSSMWSTLVLMPLRLIPGTWSDLWHVCPRTLQQALELPRYTFPYFNVWKAVWKGQLGNILPGAHLPRQLQPPKNREHQQPPYSGCPILYLYGDAKPFHLHTSMGVAALEHASPRSRVVRVEKAGHWLYLQRPNVCWAHVKHFLGELSYA